MEKAADQWRDEVDRIIEVQNAPTLSQAEAIGIVNSVAGDHHVVVNAAGSMPGDLHRLWRPSDPKAYDLEYGNSCMGYEVGGALGAKMADPSRDVFCFIGDGTFLLASQEIMTAVQEGLKLTVLLVDNYGYGSIAALSEPADRRASPASTTAARTASSPRIESTSTSPRMRPATVPTCSPQRPPTS